MASGVQKHRQTLSLPGPVKASTTGQFDSDERQIENLTGGRAEAKIIMYRVRARWNAKRKALRLVKGAGDMKLSAVVMVIVCALVAAPALAQHRTSAAFGLPAFAQYSQVDDDTRLTYAFSGVGVRLGTGAGAIEGLSFEWRSNFSILSALDVTIEDLDASTTDVIEFNNLESTFLVNNMVGLGVCAKIGPLGVGVSGGLGFNFYYDQPNHEVYVGLGLAGGVQAAIDFGEFGVVLGLDAGADLFSRYAADPLGEFDIYDSFYFFPYVGFEF